MINPAQSFDNETGQCFNFSKEIADDIFDIKVVLGSFGILLSLFATGLIVLFKFYKKFVYRLVMYLMVVNSAHAACIITQLIPIEVTDNDCIKLKTGRGWAEACAALGYLETVVNWMRNFVIIWIMLYMLKLSWQLHRLQPNQQANSLDPRLHKHRYVCETVGLISLVFSPFFFSWIPFAMNMYGISGP